MGPIILILNNIIYNCKFITKFRWKIKLKKIASKVKSKRFIQIYKVCLQGNLKLSGLALIEVDWNNVSHIWSSIEKNHLFIQSFGAKKRIYMENFAGDCKVHIWTQLNKIYKNIYIVL